MTMPQELQPLARAEATGLMTLCLVHHDEFQQLGWLDKESLE